MLIHIESKEFISYYKWSMTQRLNEPGIHSDQGSDFLDGWGRKVVLWTRPFFLFIWKGKIQIKGKKGLVRETSRMTGTSTGVYEFDDVVWSHYIYKPV